MRERIGILWDALSDNRGDQAVGLVAQRRLRRLGFGERVVAIDPAHPKAAETRLLWLAGGELLHPRGHPYYDLFRPQGPHVLFGVGTLGRPEAEFLAEYRYVSVRSKADREALVDPGRPVEITPCATILFDAEAEARDPAPAAGRVLVHLNSGVVAPDRLAELRGLIGRIGPRLAFLSFTPYSSDFALLEALARAGGAPLLRPRDPDEAYAWIRAASALVCASLHATIFAYLAGVPFLTLDYAGKIGRFLDERGLAARRVLRLADLPERVSLLAPASVDWSTTLGSDRARVSAAFEEAAALADRALSTPAARTVWRPPAAPETAHSIMIRMHSEHGLRVAEALSWELERETAASYQGRLEGAVAAERMEVERWRGDVAAREEALAAAAAKEAALTEELEATKEESARLALALAGKEQTIVGLEERLTRSEIARSEAAREIARFRGPAVHVVIVHHRPSDLLGHCLRSVLASFEVRVGVVVVRNGKEAGEPPAWAREGAPVSVLDLDRPVGFSTANNLGAEHARHVFGFAEFVLFLNDDAAVRPETVRRLVDHLTLHPECAVVGPRLTIWGAPDHLNSLGLNLTEVAEAWDEGIGLPMASFEPLPGPREVVAVTGAALLMRTSVFAALGGWNEIYGFYFEDLDLCLRVWRTGRTVRHVPAAEAVHRVSSTAGQTSPFKRYMSWRNQFLLLASHWPARRLLAIAPRLVATQVGIFARRLSVRCWSDAWLQARAWVGAAIRLPKVVKVRRAFPREGPWTRFLRPAGSVPVIRLPEVGEPGPPFSAEEKS